MSLIVNGTSIPTNVINSLIVNGVNIASVIANGVTVWTPQLGISVGWSGNSLANAYSGVQIMGIETSGFNYRYYYNYGNSAPWQSVSNTGIFSGDSLNINGSEKFGFNVSGNNIRTVIFTGIYAPTWTTLSTNGIFSGSSAAIMNYVGSYGSTGSDEYNFDTSGGYIRFRTKSTAYAESAGQWIRIN
jgi:hypothetical protein